MNNQRQKQLPGFNLLRGIGTFENGDPAWYRLAVIILIALFWLALAFILKGWVFPVAGAGVGASKLEKIITLISNKSP